MTTFDNSRLDAVEVTCQSGVRLVDRAAIWLGVATTLAAVASFFLHIFLR